MEKLRFDFMVKQTTDGKSNIICITSIATPDGHIYGIPAEYQSANLHQVIINTPKYAKVRKSLNKRYQTRKIWITLTEDIIISKIYLDDEQNLQFNGFYLEEIVEKTSQTESIPSSSNQTLEKLLEKLKIFDLHRKEYIFEVGDKVYVENGYGLNRKKMDELRIGPYTILQKLSNSIYEIDVGHKKMESNLFHITKITPVLVGT